MQTTTHDFVLAQETTDDFVLPQKTTSRVSGLPHEKVKKAQAGDVTAFGELVKMFQDAVYGVAYAMVGNFEDAQDIAQEAFINAWRNLSSLKEPTKFPNWLCRIAKNLCIDFLRQRKLETVKLQDAITAHDPSPGPLEQAEKKELVEMVLAAVRALPAKLRLTTTLFYIDGYTVNEIAEFLEAPTGTVKRRLHVSRQRLKENMMEDKKMIDMIVDSTFKSFPLPDDFADVIVRKIASGEELEPKQVIEVFGKPDKYIWEKERFSEVELSDRVAEGSSYIMVYDEAGVSFAAGDKIWEVRVESNKGYSYENEIHLGSSLEDVISFLGEPSDTVTGKPINWGYTNKVLYKDIEGESGNCYIHYKDIGIRMFFMGYRVCAIYFCKPQMTEPNVGEKVKKIIPGKANREQVIGVFGEPDKYVWGKETFSEKNLPDGYYIMTYDEAGVDFWIDCNTVREVRIGSNEYYSYEGKISLGTSLEDVISFLGEPSETVTGKPINWEYTNKVFYKDIEGKSGYCYIHYKDIGIRMFFMGYSVRAIYLCVPDTTS